MSYVIDVYRREIPATRNLLDFAVFVAYFPHLVAGPILRASKLLPQIHNPRVVTTEQMQDGAWLVAWGLLQKVFVADNLSAVANRIFEPGTASHGHQRAAGHLRIRVPDLRRLRRLLEHRARHLEDDGDRAAGELPLSVLRADAAGILASLAHQSLDLAPGLSVHSTRRQPGAGLADRPQPAHHDGARRAVARRGLDVRALGPLPRFAPHRISLGAAGSSRPAMAARHHTGCAGARLGPDVPLHVLRLADFPGAFLASAP